jgi:hypothetical protein
MKIKQKIFQLILATGITLSVGVLVPYATVGAADPKLKCAGVETSIIACTQGANADSAKKSGIWGVLIIALNILTAGVGIVAVGGVVYAAILYSSASDRAEQVKHAKDILQNIAIGIGLYAGMYLFLNFLVPGGIFS